MKVAIITDTTSDLTIQECERRNVTLIPLKICFGQESFTDQYEIGPEEFYDKMLASEALPTTSQPSPGDFVELYNRLKEEGYEGAVSMHIAAPLSGTVQAAQIAADMVEFPVKVLDSHGATTSLSLLVDAACALREEGCSLDEMFQRLCAYRDTLGTVLAPETLENFVKGGRLPEEMAQQSSMLNIRLLFTFNEEGGVAPLDKVKGSKGIVSRCISFAQEYVEANGPAYIHMTHVRNQKAVDAVCDGIRDLGLECEVTSVERCGATIATHLGIGALVMSVGPQQIA